MADGRRVQASNHPMQVAEGSRSVTRATRTPYAHPQHEAAKPSIIAITERFCIIVVDQVNELIYNIQNRAGSLIVRAGLYVQRVSEIPPYPSGYNGSILRRSPMQIYNLRNAKISP